MRRSFLVVALMAAALLVGNRLLPRDMSPPLVGPEVEKVCSDAMRRSKPDLTRGVSYRSAVDGHGTPKLVPLGMLPAHDGELVRVAGVLHAQFEWVALYPTRVSMEEDRFKAPWVRLRGLALEWHSIEKDISDRCVLIDAVYTGGAGGHLGVFRGELDVLHLQVWSDPHRPLFLPPPIPPVPTERR